MENASKALLISGAVLIAIIIASIMVYMFRGAGNLNQQYQDTMSEQETSKFNAKFEVCRDRTDITIHDIVSLVNLAKENTVTVTVKLDGVNLAVDDLQKVIKDNLTKTANGDVKLYKCTLIQYDTFSGKVKEINFKEI